MPRIAKEQSMMFEIRTDTTDFHVRKTDLLFLAFT